MESARARIQGGDMVWAATLRQARMAIQAAPLENSTTRSEENDCASPAAAVITAKTTIAPATTPSTESCARKRGRTVAPASAPRPKEVSSKPYPVAEWWLR